MRNTALAALPVLAAVALAYATSAPAQAGGAGTDGGAVSSFVARAQRGEVAPPDLDDLEHMCALLTACDKLPIPAQLIPPDFAACVKKMAEDMTSASAVNFSLTMRECGLQSNSCAALRSCAMHGADPDACSGRARSSVVGFCDVEGRALTCYQGQALAVRDCPRGGEQCIVVDGQATCTLGPCPGDIHDGDKARCSGSGTHILQCQKGKLTSLDCQAFGLRCATTADGTAGCATNGAACAGTAKRCDGNVAVGCYDGHEVRVDCAAADLVCNPVAGATPVGACMATPPATGACDPNEKPRCDGASVKYCYAGKPRSYFCKSLGFNKCDASRGNVKCAL